MLILSALAASCGPGQNDPRPGAATVGEARALEDAAQMLEQRRERAEELLEPHGGANPSNGQDVGEADPDA